MHRTPPQFWERFEKLPESVKSLARRNFELLKQNPSHPSLRFKKVDRFWSARVGLYYRALAVRDGPDFVWVWFGGRDEYDRAIG